MEGRDIYDLHFSDLEEFEQRRKAMDGIVNYHDFCGHG